MNYADKLRNPKWQKKRLEVLKKADFTCEECGEKKEELQVHHCWYEKDKEPWEYHNDCYKCLCLKCHKERQKVELYIKFILVRFNLTGLKNLFNLFEVYKIFNYTGFNKQKFIIKEEK